VFELLVAATLLTVTWASAALTGVAVAGLAVGTVGAAEGDPAPAGERAGECERVLGTGLRGGQDQAVVAGRDLHDRRLHAGVRVVDRVGDLAQRHAAGGHDVHGRLCTHEQAQRAAGGDDLVFGVGAGGRRHLGFRALGDHDVVDAGRRAAGCRNSDSGRIAGRGGEHRQRVGRRELVGGALQRGELAGQGSELGVLLL
jgi:hypothetical protein